MQFRDPLNWPLTRARTAPADRARAQFSHDGRDLTIARAEDRLASELTRYTRAGQSIRVPLSTVFIETQMPARLDGRLRAGGKTPADPGCVVYFELDGEPIALPCDTFGRLADNMAAVAGHIEADRRQERYGVGTVRDRFAGFAALPAPGETQGRAWWDVLGVSAAATQADIEAGYRRASKTAHPDAGGSEAAFHEVSEARRQGLAAAAGRGA